MSKADLQAPRPMPTITSVQPLKALTVSIAWGGGTREGKVETVDLSPLIASFKFYQALRRNPSLFETVHVSEDGHALAWGEGAIDMSATAVERLAEESMSAEDFKAFLSRNKLTQDAAAAILGRSRRQIANYLGSERIPRVVALACYGYIARKSGFDPTGLSSQRPAAPTPRAAPPQDRPHEKSVYT